MNAIAGFRKCTLTNEELAKKVDEMTDKIYQDGKIPSRHIPARPNDDYDLLVGELILRFLEESRKEWMDEAAVVGKNAADLILHLEEKDKEIERLEKWKKQEIALWNDLFSWFHSNKNITLGTSISKEALRRSKEYEVLISRLTSKDQELHAANARIDALTTENLKLSAEKEKLWEAVNELKKVIIYASKEQIRGKK